MEKVLLHLRYFFISLKLQSNNNNLVIEAQVIPFDEIDTMGYQVLIDFSYYFLVAALKNEQSSENSAALNLSTSLWYCETFFNIPIRLEHKQVILSRAFYHQFSVIRSFNWIRNLFQIKTYSKKLQFWTQFNF